MSDVPHSPGWWQAGDGRWYPPPPGLTDEMPSRPPTPAPDHPPYLFDPSAQGPSGPLPPILQTPRSRRRPFILGGVALMLVGALILAIGLTILPHSTTTASSSDPKYQMAIEDLLNSEQTNLIFIETFWDGYSTFQDQWKAASAAERPALFDQWLTESQSEVDQFLVDLQQIEDGYAARNYKNGSIPDSLRDLAMSHYRTWQDWTSQVISLANSWHDDRTSTLSLYGYITEKQPALDTGIQTTFKALCATLRNTQPTDGSYMLTINDICAN